MTQGGYCTVKHGSVFDAYAVPVSRSIPMNCSGLQHSPLISISFKLSIKLDQFFEGVWKIEHF